MIFKWFGRNDPCIARRDKIIVAARDYFERSKIEIALECLRGLEFATIDETTIRLTDEFLPYCLGSKRVIASFDPDRRPNMDEFVFIYGNYPHAYQNIVVNNPVKRHISLFWNVKHDVVEFDPRWKTVEKVYIINADARIDRYDAVLRELALARAPFDRIVRISAHNAIKSKKPDVNGQIGCLSSHVEALRLAYYGKFQNVLILEDDFCFTSDLYAHLTDLEEFFERRYAYWICLLATSKHGEITPKDDLICMTYQPCTNTAGYLISRDGIEVLLRVMETALQSLINTEATHTYAVDRCWSVLQSSNKFFVFRRKFGFQASSYSDIEGRISRYMD